MTKKQIIKALKEAKGVITVAAESLDCSRQAIYKRMKKDDDIAQARDDAREGMIDTAENALHDLITDPDHKDHYKAIRYYLSTQGKDRGYSEKHQHEHSGNVNLFEALTEQPNESDSETG